jgi:predicted component of type VI protein secretion system
MSHFDIMLFGLRITTVVVLYVFLGLAFYLLWRDLAGRNLAETGVADQLHLLNRDEATENGRGTAFYLRPVTTLGRSPDNTIVLQDETTSVTHARLTRQGGVWWLEDLESRSGTFVNDLPITRPTPLTPGDVIGIGRNRLQFGSNPSSPRPQGMSTPS